jgi:hypothetical protein
MATVVAPPPLRERPILQPPPRETWWDRWQRAKEARESEKKARAAAREQSAADAIRTQERVENDKARLETAWQSHCGARHSIPPALLPLDEKSEYHQFLDSLVGISPVFAWDAVEGLRNRINERAKRALAKVRAVQRSLSWAARFAFGKISNLLKRAKISISPPEGVDRSTQERIAASRHFLRTNWGDLDAERQAVFSVHRTENQTVVHFGAGDLGSVFLTVDDELEPDSVAEAFLSRVCRSIAKFLPARPIVSVIDGDCRKVNIKKYLKNAYVVRSFSDRVEKFSRNLDHVLWRDPPKSETASLQVGIPGTQAELSAVFEDDPPDWDLWKKEHERWARVSELRGFGAFVPASREQTLTALTTASDVLILVAHSDGEHIFMPAPPPKGSVISTTDIVDNAAAIRRNAPLVYLFCCEGARVSNLQSFAEVLLESGAVGVIAPQTCIRSDLSAAVFKELMSPEQGNVVCLHALQVAESKTGYREMEVWLA